MRKIRIAQIGTSRYSHGTAIFSTLAKYPEIFEIVGYAFPENEREKFPQNIRPFEKYREMTVEEILNDDTIEAVTVETEEIYLTKYALLAAKHGKHIHMEKPGGASLEKFEELISTVKANGTVFHTGYMYRYNPTISDIISRVQAGEIGKVISVEAQMSCWYEPVWTKWLEVFEGGIMFFLGCHLVDLVMRLQGAPKRVIPFNRSSGRYEGVNSKDNCLAVLEYENGASFVKTTSAERGGFLRRQLIITGTEGRFEVCPLERSAGNGMQCTDFTLCKGTEWAANAENFTSEGYGRYDRMMLAFGEMVRGETENPYTCDYELELFKTVKKCCE